MLLTVEMVVGVALHLIVTIVTSQLAVLIARHVVIAAGVAKTKNALQLQGSGAEPNDFLKQSESVHCYLFFLI